MALINCRECSKEISTEAPACPHCGAPKITPPTKKEEGADGGYGGCLKVIGVCLLLFVILTFIPKSETASSGSQAKGAPEQWPAATPPATPPAPTTEVAAAPQISSVTWDEIDQIYSLKNHVTDLKKGELWKGYKGKRVEWKGAVSSISESFGSLTVQIKMNSDTFTSDVIVTMRPTERDKALKLNTGDRVTYRGVLRDWGSLIGISLKDGELVSR
jgi:hypothetical protein